jgi:hypothetical protein
LQSEIGLKSNGLPGWTRLKEKIARCILTKRLIGHVPSPTKMSHARRVYRLSKPLPFPNEPYSTE